jgi:hypothetical protein
MGRMSQEGAFSEKDWNGFWLLAPVPLAEHLMLKKYLDLRAVAYQAGPMEPRHHVERRNQWVKM